MTEVQRDVIIEREAADPDGRPRSPYVIGEGIMPATRMPEFTDEELRLGLGDEYRDRLARALGEPERPVDKTSDRFDGTIQF